MAEFLIKLLVPLKVSTSTLIAPQDSAELRLKLLAPLKFSDVLAFVQIEPTGSTELLKKLILVKVSTRLPDARIAPPLYAEL